MPGARAIPGISRFIGSSNRAVKATEIEMKFAPKILSQAAAFLVLTALASAQGVVLKQGGLVLFGSAAVCSRPASIDFLRVRKATPEWKTIRAQGVPEGSGRYALLIAGMNERIRTAVSEVAEEQKRDCVFRKRDLKRANGLSVTNLTRMVLDSLR